MNRKNELPRWFPFAVVASGLIALGAGLRSNWGRAEAAAPPPPPLPPQVKQAGVLQDWGLGGTTKRWFFWYVLPVGATSYGARGPEYLTDQGAFQLEFDTRVASLGVKLYRFVYIPALRDWLYDPRNEPALLASREIRDQQGNVVG